MEDSQILKRSITRYVTLKARPALTPLLNRMAGNLDTVADLKKKISELKKPHVEHYCSRRHLCDPQSTASSAVEVRTSLRRDPLHGQQLGTRKDDSASGSAQGTF